MQKRIFAVFTPVSAPADHNAIFHNNGADRDFTLIKAQFCKAQSLFHKRIHIRLSECLTKRKR